MKYDSLKASQDKIRLFWDDWISEWYLHCIQGGLKSGISHIGKHWKIPVTTLGNVEHAYKYLPEPYWGDITTGELKGIFLNINPGEGGKNQLFHANEPDLKNDTQELKRKFKWDGNYKYSDVVRDYSKQNQYGTTQWLINKRIKWLNDIDGGHRDSLENYLFFDLVPWHTPSKKGITEYCVSHAQQIIDDVLKPVSELAQFVNGALNGKIIIRGGVIHDLLNKKEFVRVVDKRSIRRFVILDHHYPFQKMSSLLVTFKLKSYDSSFYVFSGGASMILPNPEYDVYEIGKPFVSMKLKEFLLSNQP